MVDVVLLQSVSYMAGAIGVCVAAFYYVMTLRVQQENLKETARNRRITLTTTLMEPFSTKEGLLDFLDLMTMEWTDIEDYKKKYDSRVNPQNYAKRMAMWNRCDSLGFMYREGLLDLRTLFSGTNGVVQYLWIKFSPVIEMYRVTDFTPRTYENFPVLGWEAERVPEHID